MHLVLFPRSTMWSDRMAQVRWRLAVGLAPPLPFAFGSQCPLGFSSPTRLVTGPSELSLPMNSRFSPLLLPLCLHSVATPKFITFRPKLFLSASLPRSLWLPSLLCLSWQSDVPAYFCTSLCHTCSCFCSSSCHLCRSHQPWGACSCPFPTPVLTMVLPQISQDPHLSLWSVSSPEPPDSTHPSTPLAQVSCQSPSSMVLFPPLNSVPVTPLLHYRLCYPRSKFVNSGKPFLPTAHNTMLNAVCASCKNGGVYPLAIYPIICVLNFHILTKSKDILKQVLWFLNTSQWIFLKIYLCERACQWGGRAEGERVSSRLPAERRAQHGVWSHHPEIMTLAKFKTRMFNRLHYPGAPEWI